MNSPNPMPWRAVVFPRRSSSSLRRIDTCRSSKSSFIWGSSRPWEFQPFPERFPTSNRRSESKEPSLLRSTSYRTYSSRSTSLAFSERKNNTRRLNTPRLTETNLNNLKGAWTNEEPGTNTYSVSSTASCISSEITTSYCSSQRDSHQESQSSPQSRKKSKRILTPEELRRKKLITRARQVLLLTDDGFATNKAG